ncbi:o-succinylbenzoic acid synthetase [Synechococcus sp. PCC 7502]|uniref:o-succinylbenzoate synthase n=1 Tax=Synechococcus sp. PCC 7502 TaxID=1173263 RepID=UPI00029FF387|nr:o-succinylbenzoate synthase [Synechococcus sp. PCC 7502]AFY75158.1 o-succinylbenzoic acid synthetase [Synechococcus sp. PCC 7502]
MSALIIKQINLEFFKLSLRQPIVTATSTIRERTGIVIEVIDQLHNRGLGESSPMAGFGMEPIIYTARSLKRMQRLLIGKAIASLEDIPNLLSLYNLPPAAKHGIELALLNLWASYHQTNLAKLLHSHQRSEVAVNALIGQVSPELAAQKTQQLCELGYKCFKVKVGDPQDLQRVQAVRRTVDEFSKTATTSEINTEIKIRIDANQAWTVVEAIAKLNSFSDLDIEYVEQPVSAQNLTEMAEVCRNVSIAIAADESVKNIQVLEQIIAMQAADIVILKPMVLGGILTAQKIAKIAVGAGLDVVFTTTLDGAIAQKGALQLAAMSEVHRACGVAPTELFVSYDTKINDLLTSTIPVIGGRITVI